MCRLLSMVYGLLKPYWITHVTCTCFKETELSFNVHLSCFVDFILCRTAKYMFQVNNKKIRLICWMCSKLKINTAWNRFYCWLWPQSAYQYGVSTFNLKQVFLSRVWKTSIMFWKHKKRYICFVIKVARPISFSDFSLHRIEISYECVIIFKGAQRCG